MRDDLSILRKSEPRKRKEQMFGRTSAGYCMTASPALRHAPQGDVAEWLRSGLQIRVRRFDSGRRLQQNPGDITGLACSGLEQRFHIRIRISNGCRVRGFASFNQALADHVISRIVHGIHCQQICTAKIPV